MTQPVLATGLSILNPTPRKLPGPHLLHNLVRTPANHEIPAIDFLDTEQRRTTISYPEFDRLSDQLAIRISQALYQSSNRRAANQPVIPLLIPQSPDLYIAQVAILKSAAAFCPLNLDAPSDRVKFILQDIDATIVITTSALEKQISAASTNVSIILVDQWTASAAATVQDGAIVYSCWRKPTAQDLAYVMYTSGSTGTPKGVGISHLAATQSLLAHDRHVPKFLRFLQFAAPTFDVSVFEIFFPLFRGSTLVCCNRADMLSDLPGIIRALEVDACELTPSVAGSLLRKRSHAPSLQLVLTIGEMLTQPVVEEFAGDAKMSSMLWGMYGPTEAAIHCTLQPAFRRDTAANNIGFPLDTVSAFVIKTSDDGIETDAFSVLPLGEIGELAVGGHQLANGYLNRPEQNAASFIMTEFGRIYKTGDKARMLPDGTIECLGRVSEGQIKLNGQRMELGEIEHVILQIARCHSAYVTVMSNILVAFVAVDSILEMHETIAAGCRRWLPSYMVPSDFVIMESFPRLPSGKIDRMALKMEYLNSQPAESVAIHESQFRNELERSLYTIAQDVLQTTLQNTTRLSSIGLDSLAAIQLAARLRDVGVRVSPLDVLESKTVVDLYRIVEVSRLEKNGTDINGDSSELYGDTEDAIKSITGDARFKGKLDDVDATSSCTSLQKAMLVETLKDSRLYVNTIDIRLPKDVTFASVRSWFLEVAQRNDILRSGFIPIHDELVQVTWQQLYESQINNVDNLTQASIVDDMDTFLERPFHVDVNIGLSRARITIHHAIYDGWTIDLLLDELALLAQGKPLSDRPQFRDLTRYMVPTTSQVNVAKEFWAEHLQGAPPVAFPNLKTVAVPRPSIDTCSRSIFIKPQLVRTAAQQWNVTPQAIFQASLVWLWGAITSGEDVTIGSVFSGRTSPIPGIDSAMGPCLSTLPIRTKLSENKTILDLIQSIHSVNRDVMRLCPLALSDIKKAAGIPSASRLFEILFVYQESLSSRNRYNDDVTEICHKDHTETGLLVEVEPRGDGFSCNWTYHTDLVPAPLVETFADHFSHLFAFFLQQAQSLITNVALSFPSKTLSTYTTQLKSLKTSSSLSTLIEWKAAQMGDAEALCFAHSITDSSARLERLTYRQLNEKANQIARHLMSNGVSIGGIVAIMMEKSPLLYCAILGILKTGCAYLPLLPSTPPQRVKSILQNAQPQLCVVDDASTRDNHESAVDFIDLQNFSSEKYDKTNFEVPENSSQLAYVIFTSGTTGTPKGVSVTNKNMLSNIKALSRIYPVENSSSLLQACSQAFDVSVFEIFFTWANGMRLCAATNDTLFEDLERSIRQLEVTHLSMTVTVASLINPKNVPGVKFLVTSGEAMTDEVLQKWSSVLYQGYGPSETTNICTVRKVYPGDSSQYLGWSFENTSSFVFYPDSNDLAPIGCIGELCFGGDQIADGYLNMPDVTRSKFFEHPVYGRIYRSGDRGRMLPDGSLIILGRLDSQIKLRGQRIELREIQSVVLTSPVARACASAILEKQGLLSQQLILFYVPQSEDSIKFDTLPLTTQRKTETRTLFEILRSSVPSYMVPSFIVPITCLPLTSSGKTNTEQLHLTAMGLPTDMLDECSLSYETNDALSEWTELEKNIVEALEQTLLMEKVTINRWTSFATLGLDSISAISFSRRLQTMVGQRVPISQVLQNPNIGRLASSIASMNKQSARDSVALHDRLDLLPVELIELIQRRLASEDAGYHMILPCTPLQSAMLASTISSAQGSQYCNQMLFRIKGNPENFVSYWNQMYQRHDILRTCFISSEDANYPLLQIVLKPSNPSWSRIEAESINDFASQHLKSLVSPVDSFKPPLGLATWVAQDERAYLSFVCHHALYDGVAMSRLLFEIESIARGQVLPPPPSFQSFLQEALVLPEDTDVFWSNLMKDFSPIHLPHQAPSNGTNGVDVDHQPMTISFHLPLSTIQTKLKENGASLLSLCQAAWSQTLSIVLRIPDVCFGNVFSGRSVTIDGIDHLVAPCFNTVPIRVQVLDSKSNRDLMKNCQLLNAKMLEFQFTPLRKVRSYVPTDDNHLFDTILLLQPPSVPLDQRFWTLERDTGSMDVPIVCEVTPYPNTDELKIFIHRDRYLISPQLEALLRQMFAHAIDSCLTRPSSRLDEAEELPADLQASLRMILPAETNSRDMISDDHEPKTAPSDSWTKTEDTIRQVIAQLAKVPRESIGKNTPIYRFGLDSISAIQAASLLLKEGLKVSPVDILANPTCAGIVSHIQSSQSSTPDIRSQYDLAAFQNAVQEQLSDLRLTHKPEVVLPCTSLQQGMLSQFILSEGLNYYNFVSWEIHSDQRCGPLREAWRVLQGRHQILRSGFVSVNHSDTNFAMAVYKAEEASAPVRIITGQEARNFDPGRWRQQSAQQALQDLAVPPWQVILLEYEGASSMHLGMHHALYDAFSLREMLRDLRETLQGNDLKPAVSIEAAVMTMLAESVGSKTEAERFWKEKASTMVVNSFPTLTPLRVDVPKRLRSSRMTSISVQALRDDAAKAGVTLQAVLQSAWTRVLSSYQGDSTATFGIVLSGRTDGNLADAVFPCITTLPVIGQNSANNRDLLRSMMDYNAAIRRCEHTPLTHVQKWTGYAESPIFDTILVYQQNRSEEETESLWKIVDEDATVDYPVSLEIEEYRSQGLCLNLDFRSDRVPVEHADLILAQFEANLVHLLQSPDGQADDIFSDHLDLYSILPAENAKLPSNASLLHHFVEITASIRPQNLALEFVFDMNDFVKSQRWTYRELNDFGNRVAHLLMQNGVKPRGIVAVCFDKCPEAYFTILGILKSGCAFVALDPSAPPERQQFILKDSGASVLAVSKGKTSEISFKAPCAVLEVDTRDLEVYPDTLPQVQVSPEDACYCLYTSGTTGTPKGCLITHDNAVQAMLAFKRLFAGHWDSDSRWLQFASFHFDVSVLEQYWSWSVGIPVISAPRDLILSDLISTISRLEITHIDLTPSLARLVHPDEVPSLCKGVFITGGEQLRQDILDVWGSKAVIYNAYGPTEATIGVTMYCRVPQNGRSSNIGKQFPNVGSYVLRPGSDVPVLKGGIGELCVSGKLVGKGYLNRPELTDERFPTLPVFDERVYRTGDLVRVLHDGCFDFLGRADDQVKLRGQRLEIGEINHAIKAGVPQIVDVATLVTKHRDQDRDVIVSFIVTKDSNDHERELLIISDHESLTTNIDAQTACRAKLPGYMVPTYVLCIPYIPLSANNKAQTNILKQLFNKTSSEELRSLSSGSNVASTNLDESEPQLAQIVARTTKTSTKDIHTSTTIFELGVDSISVIELARQLRASGFPGAAPSLILQNPQLGALAKLLKEKSFQSERSQVLRVRQNIAACYHRHLRAACRRFKVKQADVEYIAPCTGLQEGILSRSAISDHRSTYFNTFQLALVPVVDVRCLKSAWEQMVSKNAILRTAFLQTGDGYVQVALNSAPLRWQETQLDARNIRQHLDRQYGNWIDSNRDGVAFPLEVEYVKLEDQHTLVIRIFHATYDAHSLEILLGNISALYHGREIVAGPAFIDTLPHGPLCNYNSSKPFWQDLFSGFDLQPISRKNEVADNENKTATVTRTFDIGTLETSRIKYGATQQTMVQSAWISVLQQYLLSWPSIGVIVSGRSFMLEGIERAIGPLFNTLPYRAHGAPHDWSSLIQETHRFNTAVLEFAHIPLRQIQKWCSKGQPLFDNLFSFDREDQPLKEMPPAPWRDVASETIADYALAFEGIVTEDNHLKVTLVAKVNVVDESALDDLLNLFQSALDGIVTNDPLPRIEPRDGTTVRVTKSPDTSDTVARQRSPKADFLWTQQALEIQQEMANLAGLPVDQIGKDTTLLELGLDSIDAVKLVTRLRRLGITLMTSQLMKQPSIRGIVQSNTTQPSQNGKETSQLQLLQEEQHRLEKYLFENSFSREEIDAIFPPTPLQDSMVAEMVGSDFRHYFNHDVLELAPDVNLEALRAAIEKVVKHSDILRTCFIEFENPEFNYTYGQIIRKDLNPFREKVLLEDIAGIDDIIEHARKAAAATKGLSNLFQITPVAVAERQLVVLSIAHALYDGASLDLLHQDIRAAYTDTYQERGPSSNVLAKIFTSTSTAAEEFWSEYLHDAHQTLIPPKTDRAECVAGSTVKLERTSRMPISEIKRLCQRQRITMQALGQSCWAVVLGKLAQSLSVTFGVVLSGRSTHEEQSLMFPTMNTVAITAVLHGSVFEYLRYMWDNLTGINEFQFFPLRRAQKLAKASSGPLFNTLFTMQSRSEDSSNQIEPIWKSVQSASEVEYPLCVEMEIVNEDLVWRIACDEQYLAKVDGECILDQLDDVVQYLVHDEDGQLIDFPENNESVSICGLPAFNYLSGELGDNTPEAIDAADDEISELSDSSRQIMDVLAEVAGLERSAILPSQSIYHLGLDSISAIKASSILRKRGIIVSVRDMVTARSIGDIVYSTNETRFGQHEGNTSTATPTDVLDHLEVDALITKSGLDRVAVEKILPALPMQVHMLSAWQNTGGGLYFYEFSYEMTGAITRKQIAKAWTALVSEVSILRTYFVATDALDLPFVQITASPGRKLADDQQHENTLEAWTSHFSSSPFVSLRAHKTPGKEITVRLKIHHALYDGVSLTLIVNRLAELCGTQASSSPVVGSSTIWDNFVLAHFTKESKIQSRNFWQTYLRGATSQTWAAEMKDAQDRTAVFRPTAVHALTDIRARTSEAGVSLQALFFAAYAKYLSTSRQGQSENVGSDLVFGVYLANRTAFDESLQRVSFPTLSIVPLRVHLGDHEPLLKIAARVQRDLVEISAFENASVGLWQIAEWTGVKITSFVNFLNLPGRPEHETSHGNEEIRIIDKTPSVPDERRNISAHDADLATPEDTWLSENQVKNAYIDAVDIEAAIRGNSLDIGAFSSSSLLSRDAAADLIDHLVELLQVV